MIRAGLTKKVATTTRPPNIGTIIIEDDSDYVIVSFLGLIRPEKTFCHKSQLIPIDDLAFEHAEKLYSQKLNMLQ